MAPVYELQYALNVLAGTTGREAQGAANAWAGTTGLDLIGALNAKNGTTGLELNEVCRQLAITGGAISAGSIYLDAQASLSKLAGGGP